MVFIDKLRDLDSKQLSNDFYSLRAQKIEIVTPNWDISVEKSYLIFYFIFGLKATTNIQPWLFICLVLKWAKE